jgi:hypothetical protein
MLSTDTRNAAAGRLSFVIRIEDLRLLSCPTALAPAGH